MNAIQRAKWTLSLHDRDKSKDGDNFKKEINKPVNVLQAIQEECKLVKNKVPDINSKLTDLNNFLSESRKKAPGVETVVN